jgi:hypothetical protein
LAARWVRRWVHWGVHWCEHCNGSWICWFLLWLLVFEGHYEWRNLIRTRGHPLLVTRLWIENVWIGCCSPELNAVCRDGFEYYFVDEEFVVDREFGQSSSCILIFKFFSCGTRLHISKLNENTYLQNSARYQIHFVYSSPICPCLCLALELGISKRSARSRHMTLLSRNVVTREEHAGLSAFVYKVT